MEYNYITLAELKVHCYEDPHKKYWEVQTDGDMQTETLEGVIDFDTNHYPPGTKITVEVPICPECSEDSDMCSCGFDWNGWTEDTYA